MRAASWRAILLALVLGPGAPADETVYRVKSLEPGGPGSFDEAFRAAVAAGGPSQIQIAVGGVISLAHPLPPVPAGASITIAAEIPDLSLPGQTTGKLALEPPFGHRLFVVESSATLNLERLTLQRAALSSRGDGACIWNGGTLRLDTCWLNKNVNTNGRGGALYTEGICEILNSAITENGVFGTNGPQFGSSTADLEGGPALGAGIFVAKGQATISNSEILSNLAKGGESGRYSGPAGGHTGRAGPGKGAGLYVLSGDVHVSRASFRGNEARSLSAVPYFSYGGAIFAEAGAVTLVDCELFGNIVSKFGYGGGIHNQAATLSVSNCEIRGNQVQNSVNARGSDQARGGGVYTLGPAILQNNRIADNIAGYTPDVFGRFTSLGGNRVGNGSGGVGFVESDEVPGKEALVAVPPAFEWFSTNRPPGLTFLASVQDAAHYALTGLSPTESQIERFDRFDRLLWTRRAPLSASGLKPDTIFVDSGELRFRAIDYQGATKDCRVTSDGEVYLNPPYPAVAPGPYPGYLHIYQKPLPDGRVVRVTSSQGGTARIDRTFDGYWYLLGQVGRSGKASVNWQNFEHDVSAVFLMMFSPDNKLRWVRSVSDATNTPFLKIHAHDQGVYLRGASNLVHYSTKGEKRWERSGPFSSELIVDRRSGNFFLTNSAPVAFDGIWFVPPNTEYVSGRYIIDTHLFHFSNEGRLKWAKLLPGGAQSLQGTVDAAGDLYLSGVFWERLEVDGKALIAHVRSSYYGHRYQEFLAKLSPKVGDRSGFRLDGIEPGRVIWNEGYGDHQVETSRELGSAANWQALPAEKRGFYNTAVGPTTNQTQFFRLKKP